jgi:hypothetical protein
MKSQSLQGQELMPIFDNFKQLLDLSYSFGIVSLKNSGQFVLIHGKIYRFIGDLRKQMYICTHCLKVV